MNINFGKLLLYAPNVHTGGGYVLLRALLQAWPAEQSLVAWLDVRARERLQLPVGAKVRWVRATVGSRLAAEWSISRVAKMQDVVLCFHGLPPLFSNSGSVHVFLQNRILLGNLPLGAFGWKIRLRLRLEQTISRIFRPRVARYWVQTPSMARTLRNWAATEDVDVQVLPFALPLAPAVTNVESVYWDFIYVADGEAHKNHRLLIEAWILLAKDGIRPSLALTLSTRDAVLSNWVEVRAAVHGLKVTNLGQIPHAEVLALYGNTKALIFPSLSESFGLPLVEAREMSLPILAGELDFVRDVCEPAQSFDPNSAVSIARAVKRHLGQDEPPVRPVGADEFLRAVIYDKRV